MCQKDNGSSRWEFATMAICRNNSFVQKDSNSANVTARSSGSVVSLWHYCDRKPLYSAFTLTDKVINKYFLKYFSVLSNQLLNVTLAQYIKKYFTSIIFRETFLLFFKSTGYRNTIKCKLQQYIQYYVIMADISSSLSCAMTLVTYPQNRYVITHDALLLSL